MIFALLAASAALTGACDFGKRADDAPIELEQYAFLIGDHRIEARSWNPETGDWRKGFWETRWDGRWALNGHAIYDEWTDPLPPGSTDEPGRGANFRMWDAKNKRWSNMWMHTGEVQTTDLYSEMRDGKMVMWQVYPKPDPEFKAEFEVHNDGGWTRVQYIKNEDGSFTPRFKLDAFKIPCETGAK